MSRGLVGLLFVALVGDAAASVQLTPQSVAKIGASEFAISWEGHGTLICNGTATIPTFRVPDDAAFGQWLECHVELIEGRSNQIRILCSETVCTAHVGREQHEFDIQPAALNNVDAPRLIVERIITEKPDVEPTQNPKKPLSKQ